MEKEFYVSNIIKKHIESSLDVWGHFTWAYVVLSKNNMSINFHVTNYPEEWVKYYQENNLQFTDPVVITALSRLTPFSWDEKLSVPKEFCVPSIFEKSKDFSVINGYTFVLHDHKNHLATLSFIINPAEKEKTEQTLFINKGDLNLLLASIHEEFLALTTVSENNKLKGNEACIFTERENEILYWSSVGKTYLETGEILGIKTTTVKFHMSNIVKKLGVTNARHAVRLGIELHLVKPVS